MSAIRSGGVAPNEGASTADRRLAHACVVGSGLRALAVARVLVDHFRSVTLIEPDNHRVSGAVEAPMRRCIRARYGVALRPGRVLCFRVGCDGTVDGFRLSTGDVLDADLVVVTSAELVAGIRKVQTAQVVIVADEVTPLQPSPMNDVWNAVRPAKRLGALLAEYRRDEPLAGLADRLRSDYGTVEERGRRRDGIAEQHLFAFT